MASRVISKLKVIIVGGSVSGLTLAHSFDSAGIDYVLLEARDSITPHLGSGILLQPNGARILDQLGIYEGISKNGKMQKMTRTTIRRTDGTAVNVNEWPRVIEQQLGYPSGLFERRRFLQALYDELQHKEKVQVSKRVISILDRDDSVLVQCSDGSTYRGDIVVGADGVHSKVRKEMQRLTPPSLLANDKKSITSEYACFFGVSSHNPQLQSGEIHVISDVAISAHLFVGSEALPMWFCVTKLDQKYYGDDIPRYTESEMKDKILEYGHYQFEEGVTVRDLMATATSLNYLALEEATHEVWTYGRIVCVGDAIHKMTPNLGQGGNQSIEGPAVLTNCLLEMLSGAKGESVRIGSIENALLKYQKLRAKRAQYFVQLSGYVTRYDAMATLKHTLRFLYMPFPSSEATADIKSYAKAAKLNHLPLPVHLKGYKAWSTGDDTQSPRPEKSSRAQ